MEQWTGERAAVLSKVLWVGGWAKALATVDFDSLNSSAKPVPNFDWCSRDQFVGTGRLVLSIALSICLSGFVVWFVVSDQWFVLKDQISARNRCWYAHSLASVAPAHSLCKGMRNKERVDSIFVIRELVQLQTQAVMAIILLGMCVKLSLLNWSSTLFLISKSHLLLLFGSQSVLYLTVATSSCDI